MVQFTVLVKDLAIKARFYRAMMKFRDFTPEMEKVGDFLLDDARKRLAARNSDSSIGRLAKSLVRKAYRGSVLISSVLPYARIQQEGGTVYPKRGKMLAIPIRLADRRAHVWPRMISGRPGVSLFTVKLGPKVILMYRREKSGKKGTSVEQYPRWILVPKVTIKARPYLVRSKELISYMRQVMGDKLRGLGAA